jgi:3-oxoadipate enol-lactonase
MQINLGQATLNYELEGPEDAPVVMFSHSLAADLTMFDAQMPAFRDAGYRTLRYDMRGHGASPAPEEAQQSIRMQDLAGDAVALMDHLNIASVHWVGLSMGGMIGQVLGHDHGARVDSLALTSTSSYIPQDMAPIWDERIAIARTHGMGVIADGTIERWFTEPAIAAPHPAIDPVKAMIQQTSVEGFTACVGAIKQWRFRDQLGAITTPTLVVQGRHDPSTTVEAGEVIAARIPGARLEVVEDASHFANVEQPDRWTALVKGWVDAQSGRAA